MVSGRLVTSSAGRCTTSADLWEPYRGEKATPGGLALCRSGHGRPAERGATLDTAWWPRAVGSHRPVAPCCGVTPPGGPVLWGHTAWWPRVVGSHRLVAPCCGVTLPGGPVLWGHPAWWPRAVGSHRLVAPCCGVTPPGGPVLWGHTAWWPRAVGSHRLVAPCCGVTPPGGPVLWGHFPTPYGRMAVTPLTTGHAPDWGDNERLPTGHRRAVMARSCPA